MGTTSKRKPQTRVPKLEVPTQEPPLEVTPLEVWKKKREDAEPVLLPDGNVVRVRKLDLFDLAVTGHVPFSLVKDMEATCQKLRDPEKLAKAKQEELRDMNAVLRKVALKAVVEPRISETGGPDVLLVDELGVMNLLTIFSASVNSPEADLLRPFRNER